MMRLIADRSNRLRRAAAALILGAAYSWIALPAHADECAAPALVVSQTTLAQARERWAACNAIIVGEGHLAIGGGNGVDGMSQVGLKQVLLVTVDGIDFEGLPVARYAFVDEVLYAVTAQLRTSLSRQKSPFKELSDDEIDQLEQTLTSKYGKPRALKDMGAGKKPNIFIWDLRDNEMMLSKSIGSGYQLTLRNKALGKKVEAYKRSECKLHRQKAGTETPVTAVCV